MDFAVLFMRLFAGGMMLLHNIGKIQNYNEIIGSYPSFLFIEQQAVFVIVAAAEVLLSLLIIVGLWVRAAAFWMAAGILALLAWSGFEEGELRFLWLGIFLFLVLSGGGTYAFDSMVSTREREI
ncbi:MAG: DoxX family protein [Alistipes sp.]|nr:DoxX family protein [Alistipes sp.]